MYNHLQIVISTNDLFFLMYMYIKNNFILKISKLSCFFKFLSVSHTCSKLISYRATPCPPFLRPTLFSRPGQNPLKGLAEVPNSEGVNIRIQTRRQPNGKVRDLVHEWRHSLLTIRKDDNTVGEPAHNEYQEHEKKFLRQLNLLGTHGRLAALIGTLHGL